MGGITLHTSPLYEIEWAGFSMKNTAVFQSTFQRLRAILEPYAAGMNVVADTADHYYLNTKYVTKNRKPMFFAAVRSGKAYVSFHLMPVYVEPDLLKTISPELRKRMQGKSCFNFTAPEEKLLKELAKLTRVGFTKFKELGYL